MTIVCGDSHTATHGAFGALAFGIGTSEVEHVLATQTLLQSKPKTLELRVDGALARGVTAKDMILYLIGQITHRRRHRLLHRIHRRVRPRAVDGRADDGLQHVDRSRGAGRHDRPGRDDLRLPPRADRKFAQGADFDKAVARWKQLPTDPGAKYDESLVFNAANRSRRRSPGAPTPARSRGIGDPIPIAARFRRPDRTQIDRSRRWSTWA